MEEKVLLIVGIGDSGLAEAAAMAYAKDNSSTVVALQILTSNLYHYGHNDLIATRPSKRDFLLYIRSEAVGQGREDAERLAREAEQCGVSMEIVPVETEDVNSTVITEAKKGYGAVFVPKERRKIFPLLQRNLCRELEKRVACRVVAC
jgi:hypothetical protein